jgi:hypothetical protein
MDADDFSNEINLEESRWEFDINMICIREYFIIWERIEQDLNLFYKAKSVDLDMNIIT